MFKTFDLDKPYIERKFHNPDEPFNPYTRMIYHGSGYDENSGLDDDAILEGLKKLADEIADLPHPVAKAKAIEYVLQNERLYVNEHDYFVGLYSLNRLANSVTFWPWEAESKKKRKPELIARERLFNDSAAVSLWPDYDHVVPDWESIVNLGIRGIIERAENYKDKCAATGHMTKEQEAFFDGIIMEYSSILMIIDRWYRLALTKTHEKAEKIAVCLKHLYDGAPTNIYEAMQLMFIYFLVSESIDSYQVRSLGNGLDRTLYPFYQRDLENGTFTREEIKEYLAYFMMQWSAIGNYWGQPFYLAGTNLDGTTRVNNLSYDILEVYDQIKIYNPKIQIKYSKSTPVEFTNKVLDMIRRGQSCFVFCCEPAMVKGVMSYGATYEEALDMDIRGCYETGVRANEVATGTGYINAAKAVEYVFSNGWDRRIGAQVGLKTGDVCAFRDFREFYYAVLSQWMNLVDQTMEIVDDYEPWLSFVNPSSLYSGTVVSSLENARDGYQNGVKFNNSTMLNCSFATMVDSIMVVKKLVFENKEVTMAELKQAIEDNWEGHEQLREKVLHLPYKFGNDEPETDQIADALSAYFCHRINNRPNKRNGVYKSNMHSAMQFLWQGEKTLATPDGRKAGMELAKNADPVSGADKNGVTSMIQSATSLSPFMYPESFCVDLMLHPSATEGEDGLVAMKSLIDTYMDQGGQSIQMNVFLPQMLRDAQEHPENYPNLQVRVCGWNVLWNNLSRKEQDEYIVKAESVLQQV